MPYNQYPILDLFAYINYFSTFAILWFFELFNPIKLENSGLEVFFK